MIILKFVRLIWADRYNYAVSLVAVMKNLPIVNQRVPNIEGKKIVTGQARYAGDIRLAGTLTGKVLRSPHASQILQVEIDSLDIRGGVVVLKGEPPERCMLLVPTRQRWKWTWKPAK